MEHRRDVDGLRAIAVLSIILFHAGFSGFPGGYVGVDIFFVISGFLITGIILREQAAQRFSLAGFYERRARRILPALLVMLAATAAVAYVVMLPLDFRIFAQTMTAVVLFCSNVLFWKRSGAVDFYFDAPARLNPLLHTWSLGVEEQFYLFFPLLMLLGWRLGRRRLFLLVLVTAVASFVYSSLIDGEWGLGFRAQPETNFYLLPPRAWQIAAGSLLAFYESSAAARSQDEGWRAEVAAFVGVALLMLAVLIFRESEIHSPSLYALAPIIGTVLLLKYGRRTAVGSLLSSRPLVAIGLISYSAYLWHQPLFAFSHYIDLDETLSTKVRMGLCLVTVLLAYVSWRWVENPFRDRRKVSRPILIGVCTAGSLCLLLVGATFALTRNPPMRGRLLSERLARTLTSDGFFEAARECGVTPPRGTNESELGCLLNPAVSAAPEFIVAGDSHAGALLPAFQRVARRLGQQGRLITSPGCTPLIGLDGLAGSDKCRGLQGRTIDLVQRQNAKRVFLVARWTAVTHDIPGSRIPVREADPTTGRISRADFGRALAATIDAYARLGVHLYIVEQVPQQIHRPVAIYIRALLHSNPRRAIDSLSVTQAEHETLQEFVRTAFSWHRSGRSALTFIDVSGALCKGGVCLVGAEDQSYYSDFTHLSGVGAVRVSDELERLAFSVPPSEAH